MPDLHKILDFETNLEHRYIPDQNILQRVVEQLKAQKKKIVLTQGVFDLIHEGHAMYLAKARRLGDVLIVGIDSDEFTRQRKGPNRPIVPQTERINMLVHLRHVDIVTIREVSHGIGDLIHLVKPDVLVTSSSTSDFTEQMKRDYDRSCGEIVTFPPQATTSTTARIRNLTIEGAETLAREIKALTESFLEKIKGN